MNLCATRSDRNAFLCGSAAVLVILALVVTTASARAQCAHELAKLIASDAATDDYFGHAAAVFGDTAVVGAYFDDDAGPSSGSAYVFVRSGGAWPNQAKLVASDAAPGDEFGISVALFGDTAIVGARGDDNAAGNNAGSVYVFVRIGGVWTQQAKLTASDAAANEEFGVLVALSGDTAVVGAHLDDNTGGTDAGAAYVFVRSGTVWTEQVKLTASDAAASDFLGGSVAISGHTAVVGAYQDDHAGGINAGSAYVFVRSGGVWTEQAKLIASDAALGDEFGISVAVFGDSAAVGARFGNHVGVSNTGSAYIFVRSSGVWTEQAKLIAFDAASGDEFGRRVALSGDTVVVGAPYDDNAGGPDAGSAYVFVRSVGVWTQQAKLTASDAAASDQFGFPVAASGDTVVVGAQGDDQVVGVNAGSAYVFDISDYDADGVSNISDLCPYTSGGCAVDAEGRPLFDLNDDCIVNGLDMQIIVDEILLGTGWDIAAVVEDLLRTCSPCS